MVTSATPVHRKGPGPVALSRDLRGRPAALQRQLVRSTREFILVDINPMLNGEQRSVARRLGYAQPT